LEVVLPWDIHAVLYLLGTQVAAAPEGRRRIESHVTGAARPLIIAPKPLVKRLAGFWAEGFLGEGFFAKTGE
jgi:hypothetical protein